jgi:hypothetical protein
VVTLNCIRAAYCEGRAESGDHRRAAGLVDTPTAGSTQSRSVCPRIPEGDPREGCEGTVPLRGLAETDRQPAFPATGLRPRQALLSLPRGNGKTSLAAVLGAYGLYADGVESAEVVVVASDARQAGITLRQIARMVELEPRLAEQTQVFQSRLYVPHTDSTLVVLPAEPGALQGWNPSLAIVDEFYVVNRQVWDAVSLAAGKLEIPVTRTLPGMLATPW